MEREQDYQGQLYSLMHDLVAEDGASSTEILRADMPAAADTELLALADRLMVLIKQTSAAWAEYSNMVWPAVGLAVWGDKPLHPDDVPGRLRLLRATAPEGQAAKGIEILALNYAASWCECRDDTIQLMESPLRHVAGRPEPDRAESGA